MKTHYTAQYLLDPSHPVTVALIGCGGTGSQVLTCLARIDSALKALGHPGLHVIAYDSRKVTRANLGRQLFSTADVGVYKTTSLISRINRFFGLDWESYPVKFNSKLSMNSRGYLNVADHRANIIISCVDKVQPRRVIGKICSKIGNNYGDDLHKLFYWLDFGNSQKTGQVILGTLRHISQPEDDAAGSLPTVVEKFDLSTIDEDTQGPSCSLAESLHHQDLFVNSCLAQLGMDLIWKLFRDLKLTYHGLYMNLETMKVNPIYIE